MAGRKKRRNSGRSARASSSEEPAAVVEEPAAVVEEPAAIADLPPAAAAAAPTGAKRTEDAPPRDAERIRADGDDAEEESEEESVYDSGDDALYEDDDGDDGSDADSEEEEGSDDASSEGSDAGFEDQGSDTDDDDVPDVVSSSDGSVEVLSSADEAEFESVPRRWPAPPRPAPGTRPADPAAVLHADDRSSDEDDEATARNRIGAVPLHWYDGYEHVGYDADGARVAKPAGPSDALERALSASDGGGRTVRDELHGRDVEVDARRMELLRRIAAGAYPHPEADGTPDYVDYFSGIDPEISGLGDNKHPPKSRFQPSKWEKLAVRRLLQKLKEGAITMEYLEGKVKDMNEYSSSREKAKEQKDGKFLLWKEDDEDELALRKGPQHIPPPKVPPPTHAESYNPSEEYLPTEEDLKEWEEMDAKERPHGLLIPKKFKNLRTVGAYEHSVRERFERCLDLYLCPRLMKRRLNIDPESLVPQLPKPADLRPFPTSQCVEYVTPHDEDEPPPAVRCLAASDDGQYLASGAADGCVRIWEVQTGRLLRSFPLDALVAGSRTGPNDGEKDDAATPPVAPVTSLAWNPNPSYHLLLATVSNLAVVVSTGTGGADAASLTARLLSSSSRADGPPRNPKAATKVSWKGLAPASPPVSAGSGPSGPSAVLTLGAPAAEARWHAKGDYFLTVAPEAGAASVLVHRLSAADSQAPFSKPLSKGGGGGAVCASFHPTRPFLVVATKTAVKVCHLLKRRVAKKLVSGCRRISCLDVHPGGDHVLVGSLDRRLVWFDLDLGTAPYKTLRFHERALRGAGYHPRRPLMASCGDDGTVHVFHSTVYSDLARNPLVVPVKVLRGGHDVVDRLGVLALAWHPFQPWIFSAGNDGRIRLWQDV